MTGLGSTGVVPGGVLYGTPEGGSFTPVGTDGYVLVSRGENPPEWVDVNTLL